MRLNVDYMELDGLLEKVQKTLPENEKLTRNEVKTFEAIFYRLAEIQNADNDYAEIELKPCPLCGRDVEWRDGRIMCWCGIMYRNRNYISTVEGWNKRGIEKPNCSELPNS